MYIYVLGSEKVLYAFFFVKKILQEGSGVFGLYYSGTGKVREKKGTVPIYSFIPLSIIAFPTVINNN